MYNVAHLLTKVSITPPQTYMTNAAAPGYDVITKSYTISWGYKRGLSIRGYALFKVNKCPQGH